MYTKIFRASVKVPQCYSFLLVDAMVSKPHPQAILWFLQDKGFLSLFVTSQSPSGTLEVRAGSCPGTRVQVRLQIPAGLPGWCGWAPSLPWSAGGQHRDTSSHAASPWGQPRPLPHPTRAGKSHMTLKLSTATVPVGWGPRGSIAPQWPQSQARVLQPGPGRAECSHHEWAGWTTVAHF